MTRHYPDLGSASDWSSRVGNVLQPIIGTTQIWVVTRLQYGISALVTQTSFPREITGSVRNCWLFSQVVCLYVFIVMCASFYMHALMFCVIKSLSKTWCLLLLNDLSIFVITMLTVIFFLEFVYSLYSSSVLVNLHVLSCQSSLSPLQGSPRVNTERNYAASILSRILLCDLLTYSPSCPIELIYY